MAAGLPIEKWLVLFLLAGQSVLSPVQPAAPAVSGREALSSLKASAPAAGLTESVVDQIRSELAQSRSV